MRIWCENDKIYFSDEKMKSLGYTDYDDKLFEKINSVNWTVSKGRYLYSSKLKRSLHQVVMAHWYGEDAFIESRKNKFIIEHHNNEGFDCQISNLSFAPEPINKAKAFTYDPDRKSVMPIIAVNFYKDFQSGKYQITVGFNKPHYLVNPAENKAVDVTAIYLLYKNDFYRTMTDASTIIHELKTYSKINLANLRYEKLNYKESIIIEMEPGNEDAVFFEHEGRLVMRLGTDHAILNSVSPDNSLFNDEGNED